MVKLAQIIALVAALLGNALAIPMLLHQSGRGEGGDDDTFEITRPCLQSNGEPC